MVVFHVYKIFVIENVRHPKMWLERKFSSSLQTRDGWLLEQKSKRAAFSEIIANNQYQVFLEFIDFNGNSSYNGNFLNRDKLFKLRPLLDYLVSKFKNVYTSKIVSESCWTVLLERAFNTLKYNILKWPGMYCSKCCNIFKVCLTNHFGTLCIKNRSSRPEMFLRKGVLKIWSKFTGEHPCVAYFQKTFSWEHLWAAASAKG